MKSQSVDPGLEYMISIGFRPAKTWGAVETALANASDRKTALRFLKTIDERASGKRDEIGFYSMKNENYNLSLALTSAFDADILRKACNWIVDNKDLFGSTILEVGCDCGVMTVFLAKAFPEAKIVAIDRCKEAIVNAKRFANLQGVNNVEFLECDLKDLQGQYDTIFSMRTVHENFESSEDVMREIGEAAAIYSKALAEYAEVLATKLSNQGLLVSIERIPRNALLLGWMEALFNAGLLFSMEHFEEIICKELNQDSVFHAFVCFHERTDGINAKEVFDQACQKHMDYSKAEYWGTDAKIVFENRRGELIEGYNIEYPYQHAKVRVSLWTHKYDETGLVLFENNNGNVHTCFMDISQRDEVLDNMHKALGESRSIPGAIITKI